MTTLGMPTKRAGGRIKVCDIYIRTILDRYNKYIFEF